MDAAKWSQGFQDHANLMKPMEEMVPNACNRPPPTSEKKPKPPEHINCPRCNSTNTKFCYYNNYSLTQPRYFCKACRRYWTEGGSLRNVPVGGGSRKNKRSTSSTSSINKVPDLNPQLISSHNPNNNTNPQKGQDLNLAFPMHEGSHGNLPHFLQNSSSSLSTSSSFSPAFELMRTNGMVSTGGGHGLSSFAPGSMPDSNAIFSSNFSMQDYKPTLSFTINGVQENAGRVFFPFGDHQMKSTNEVDGNKGQGNSSGYWNNGVLGGGGSWQ